jgi:hypothetical protein
VDDIRQTEKEKEMGTRTEKTARVLELIAQASEQFPNSHLVTQYTRNGSAHADCLCGWSLTAANEEAVIAESKFHSLTAVAKDSVNA